MLKVTLIIFLFFVLGCQEQPKEDLISFEQELNRQTEVNIDSAYEALNTRCDSLVQSNALRIIDSINNIKKKGKP
ncbi:MAG: hypothetical protein ABIY51_14740 [Ferruginibacter sp.]